jgi:hypothetical protein
MDFPPTGRIDTRLTVIDWPADADDALVDAVTSVTTFEIANDGPTVLIDGDRRHLVWRGYLTGGLLTLYERLGQTLSQLGMSAFYADPRIEVFVPARGDVVVLGALRQPIPVSRQEWDARVAGAGSAAQLAMDLMPRPSTAAEEIIAEARRAAEQEPHPFLAPRPEAFEMPAPGEVQFDLLDDAECELTERYDPEGSLDAARLSFGMLRWRTDFLAPLTVLPPFRSMMDSLTWRVTQWEWVEDGQGDDEGGWTPCAQMPVTVREVVDRVPPKLALWVRGMTELAIAQLEELAEEQPAFHEAAETLRWEVARLRS